MVVGYVMSELARALGWNQRQAQVIVDEVESGKTFEDLPACPR